MPDRWIPAVYRGQPTTARFYLAVHFEMKDARDLAPAPPAPALPPTPTA
ncbi:MAG: hypothetical protein WKG07_09705 [Hymenobacter sp.]